MRLAAHAFVLNLIFTNIRSRSHYSSPNLLSYLQKSIPSHSDSPIIVILNPTSLKRTEHLRNEDPTFSVGEDRTLPVEDPNTSLDSTDDRAVDLEDRFVPLNALDVQNNPLDDDRTVPIEVDRSLQLEDGRTLLLESSGDRTSDFDDDQATLVDSGAQRDDEDSDDQAVYNLYNVLRTQPDHELGPKVAEKLQETKQVLRQALIRRCGKLNRCLKKCMKPKKFICTLTCQEQFDEMDACSEPPAPKCETKNSCGQKWGKTMPPHWSD